MKVNIELKQKEKILSWKQKRRNGCGRMLAISEDRDCGVYCPFCQEVHLCVLCDGKYELHPIAIKMMVEEIRNSK